MTLLNTKMEHAGNSAGSLGKRIVSILIIDDDMTSRLILEGILSKQGYSVFKAQNGQQGRLLANHIQPDLILLDVEMPGENGLTTCTLLKENPGTEDIPVLFISGITETEAMIEGFNVGGVDYITKPYHPVEVLARVRVHIRVRQVYRALVNSYTDKIRPLAEAQQDLFVHPDELPEARFAVSYTSLQQAGGDFYDVIHAGEGFFEYMVADISGHDLGTVMATSVLKALYRQNVEMLYSPIENLNLLNKHLKPILQEGQYVTMVLARLNRATSKMSLFSAGHPPAILLHNRTEVMEQEGDLLGIHKTIFTDAREIDVAKGDRIFLYSDGLIEQGAHGAISRSEGIAALQYACEKTSSLALDKAVTIIKKSLLPSPNDLNDDVVLLAFEV